MMGRSLQEKLLHVNDYPELGVLTMEGKDPAQWRRRSRVWTNLAGVVAVPLVIIVCILVAERFIWNGAVPSNSLSSTHPRTLTAPFGTPANEDTESGISTTWSSDWGWGWGGETQAETLVLYIFSNTDGEYIDNLRFFIRNGIQEGDGCEYLIVFNTGEGSPDIELPDLPSSARYVRHANECYDWGTFGWALETQNIDTRKYKHFIFLNSSVRGPYLPSYLPDSVHFSQLMIAKLSETVKLVGATISCEKGPGNMTAYPHVQSFSVATDQIGLKVLVDDGRVFECHDDMDSTVQYSEIGSSKAIINAGYNILSFMTRYQGVDWRNDSMWGCNMGENPFNAAALDDMSLHPMELMFVKVKHWGIQNSYPSMKSALQYDTWQKDPKLAQGGMLDTYEDLTAPHILATAAKGPDCWDCAYYYEYNPDLLETHPDWECFDAFTHFTNYGQFELRPHRWLCNSDWSEHGVPFNPGNTGERWPVIKSDTCNRPPLSASSADLLVSLNGLER